jgi:hypothetical protein
MVKPSYAKAHPVHPISCCTVFPISIDSINDITKTTIHTNTRRLKTVRFHSPKLPSPHNAPPPVNCCTRNIPRPSPLIPIADLGRGRSVPFEPPPVNWTATLVGVPSCFVGLRRPPVICLARAASVPLDNPVNWRAMVVRPVCWGKTRSNPELAAESRSLDLEGDERVGDPCDDRSSWGRSN